ncbi:MAG: hypothetical protein CMN55_02945 [Sneathiella sp.]|jgi:outer membrane protein OmpA-like peptidoglycan-associated protein|uniref:OmpA family protein n=1 Tax=Sneathiella sp. TaxID=1964365 RepID=UPI000C5A4054|nr:OmpA family protein [Sneathiella sp.]MAL78063.1 hypothetical protein [Sneathiella sp.]
MTSFTATLFPLSLLVPLIFASAASSATTQETSRSPVEINLHVLNSGASADRQPIRVMDGETVIILTPPDLQPPKPAQKIVTPLVKPSLALPETATPQVPTPPPSQADAKPVTSAEKSASPSAEDAPPPVSNAADNTAADVSSPPTPPQAVSETAGVTEQKTEIPTPPQSVAMETSAPLAKVEKEAEKITEPLTATDDKGAMQIAKPADAVTERADSKEMTVAAISPDTAATSGSSTPATATSDRLTRVLFADGATELSSETQGTLQAIARQLSASERENIQLLAYGTGGSVSAARRLSLGRALAVRARLMELGVDNTQIEVRALGEPQGDGPPNRVDLLLITR